MTQPIDFYTNPHSRGQIVRWMLEEAGALYTEHLLEYGTTMKAPEYLAINPMGKVPAIRHDGQVVTECAAICAYLADTFPDAGLAPTPAERGDYYRWLFFAAGPVEAAVSNAFLKVVPTPEQEVMMGYGNFDRVLDVLDDLLKDRAFVTGDRFTAADVYVGSQILWGMVFQTIPSRPSFEAYAARLRERPAYQTAKARDNELIAAAEAAKNA